ncbi:MAG: DUF5054 domain-containing protein [Thermodesulfobacteriota bacterium]|nr:DUF5054 domain-containing protein [Thermodesulfobacteriota bacterium]
MRDNNVNTVYVIFKTHLDIGFTDFARTVKRRYIECFLPAAIDLAERLRKQYRVARFVWTTGSWLIYESLEESKGEARKRLENAIVSGDIVWHALPFTTHTELMDASLFRFSLSLSHKLDMRFGKETIAGKMTDVPGHTRAVVPLLAEAGIRFLHIGVNPASTSPDVPEVFVWRHTNDTEVVVMYHKCGYGGTSHLPGMTSALAVTHTDDNLGPPDNREVSRVFNQLKKIFPEARIVASTLDNYARELLQIKETLPVIEGEIGDTWIHGVGTDPKKVAQFRELSRLRSKWLTSGHVKDTDRQFERFSRSLILVPEHTWGMDEKTHLSDHTSYTIEDLNRLRRTRKCKHFELSWQEQRNYIAKAVQALCKGSLGQEAKRALFNLEARRPDITSFRKVTNQMSFFSTRHFTIGFDRCGALCHLKHKASNRIWATKKYILGQYTYELFSSSDYDRYVRQYLQSWPRLENWALEDFTKPGMEASNSSHQVFSPELTGLFHREDSNEADHFLLELTMPSQALMKSGSPARLTLEVIFPVETPSVELIFQWFDKRAYRLPEASWFSFSPKITSPSGWTMEKMGVTISPYEVVINGNRKLHAVNEATYNDPKGKLRIESLDVPLVAPGERSLLNFNNRVPPLKGGMHFNLHNNVWGTNFPMWYDEDARFRFVLTFQ